MNKPVTLSSAFSCFPALKARPYFQFRYGLIHFPVYEFSQQPSYSNSDL